MITFKEFRKGVIGEKYIELTYSFWHFVSGNPRWFCRIWDGFNYKESYGKNKFDAYRKALS